MKTKEGSLSRRAFGSMAASAVMAGALNAQSNKGTKLRVLCYNIHYGQGSDGVYDIPRIASVIKAAQPDLVALQEIDVHVERSKRLHELRMLADLTGMQGRFGPTQHYQGGLFGNGILSRFPIDDIHIEPLPYTESSPGKVTYPRAAVAAVVEVPEAGKIRFISTHFQHATFKEDRLAQAKAINARFACDNSSDDVMGKEASSLPTILAGDFNASPGSPPIEELQKKWKLIMDKEEALTSPTWGPKYKIDFILFRNTDPFKVVESHVIDEKIASDHFPVFALLELTY